MDKKIIIGTIAGVTLLGGTVFGVNASTNHTSYLELQDKLATLNITDYSEENTLVKDLTLDNMQTLYDKTYSIVTEEVTKLIDLFAEYDLELDFSSVDTLDSAKDYFNAFLNDNKETIINTIYDNEIDLSSIEVEDEILFTYIESVSDEVNTIIKNTEIELAKLEEEKQVKAKEEEISNEGSNEPSETSSIDTKTSTTNVSNTTNNSSSSSSSSNSLNNSTTSSNSNTSTSNNNSSNTGGGSSNNTTDTGSSNNNSNSGGSTTTTDPEPEVVTCGSLNEHDGAWIVVGLGYDTNTAISGREWNDSNGCLSWSYEWEDGTFIYVTDTGWYSIEDLNDDSVYITGQA